MDEMKWKKLADVYGRLEAEAIKSYLEAEGVSVELIQEAIGQLIPTNLDAFGQVQLFVSINQLEKARSLLENYQNSTQSPYIKDQDIE